MRGVVELPIPRHAPVFGCVSVGVGSSPPRSVCVRFLDRAGEQGTHQPSRSEGGVPCPSGVPTSSSWSVGSPNVRQLHGSSLCQQAGGCVPQLLWVDKAASVFGRSKHRGVACQVSPGKGQYSGGSVEPKGSGTRLRVVVAPRGSETCLRSLRDTHDRPICNQVEQEAPAVLFTGPRPHGSSGG